MFFCGSFGITWDHLGVICCSSWWLLEASWGLLRHMAASEAGFLASVPMGEAGRVTDIANGVIYLISDASRYVTGSELVIDGGFYAT